MIHLVSINGLNLKVADKELLEGFTLNIAPGEKVGLTGVSGVGKTTLLRSIATNRLPKGSAAQHFKLCGQVIGKIAYVPQRGGLLEWYSVRKNFFALTHGTISMSETEMKEVRIIAEEFGIGS